MALYSDKPVVIGSAKDLGVFLFRDIAEGGSVRVEIQPRKSYLEITKTRQSQGSEQCSFTYHLVTFGVAGPGYSGKTDDVRAYFTACRK